MLGLRMQTETQFEVERLVEGLLLKDAGANDLAGNGGEHFVFARGENVDLGDLRLLVKLLGAELNRLARAMLAALSPTPT
jgi:hypothetical protein